MAPEMLESGALGLSLLIVYSLIDKALIPMLNKKKGVTNGNGTTHWSHQEYKNSIYERRLTHTENGLSELRATVEEARTSIQVAQVILKRIEDSM